MNILNIDSTSSKLFITLSRQGVLQPYVSRESGRNYMEMIIYDIDRMLKKAGMDIMETDAIGVNKGPGDFTGTRIGISVVKTLGWVLDIPVYGINALDVMAHSITYTNRRIISKSIASGKSIFILPCLDVRKEELYFSYYKVESEEKIKGGTGAIAGITVEGGKSVIFRKEDMSLVNASDFPGSFDRWLAGVPDKKTVIIGGNCITEYSKMLSGITGKDPDLFLDTRNILPHPGSLDICVRYFINEGVPTQRVDPVYVRDFIPFGR